MISGYLRQSPLLSVPQTEAAGKERRKTCVTQAPFVKGRMMHRDGPAYDVGDRDEMTTKSDSGDFLDVKMTPKKAEAGA